MASLGIKIAAATAFGAAIAGGALYADKKDWSLPLINEETAAYTPNTDLPPLQAQATLWKLVELGFQCPVDAETQIYNPERTNDTTMPGQPNTPTSTTSEVSGIPLAVCIDYSKSVMLDDSIIQVPLALQEWPGVPTQEIRKSERTDWCVGKLAARYANIVNEQLVLITNTATNPVSEDTRYPVAIAMSAGHEDPCDTIFTLASSEPEDMSGGNKDE
jgi:hypothetical protein